MQKDAQQFKYVNLKQGLRSLQNFQIDKFTNVRKWSSKVVTIQPPKCKEKIDSKGTWKNDEAI